MIGTKALAMTVLAALATTTSTVDAASSTFSATRIFSGAKCTGDVKMMVYMPLEGCAKNSCIDVSGMSMNMDCVTDYKADITSQIKGASYVSMEIYTGDCTGNPTATTVVVADGKCYAGSETTSFKVTLGSDSSVTWKQYTDNACSKGETSQTIPAANAKGECFGEAFKMKVTAVKGTSSGSSPATTLWSASVLGSAAVLSATALAAVL